MQNIRIFPADSNSEAGKYATGIMAYPTTIVLDRNGNIIGEPIMGGIDNDEAYKQLMKDDRSNAVG